MQRSEGLLDKIERLEAEKLQLKNENEELKAALAAKEQKADRPVVEGSLSSGIGECIAKVKAAKAKLALARERLVGGVAPSSVLPASVSESSQLPKPQ